MENRQEEGRDWGEEKRGREIALCTSILRMFYRSGQTADPPHEHLEAWRGEKIGDWVHCFPFVRVLIRADFGSPNYQRL
jgi:hypothetical protein